MIFRIACGTNNGKIFTTEHFGDSKFFLIHELDSETLELRFIEKIYNNSEEEKMHGDAVKAKGVSGILNNVDVLIAFTMGPNITRMRKKFVPVISREIDIEKSLELFKGIVEEILPEIKIKSRDKKIFYLF